MIYDKQFHHAGQDLRKLAKPRHILVVEDDRTMRMFIEQQLRGLGFETSGVGDGEAARTMLDETPDAADVILLDRTLPGMNGADLVRHCRASPALSTKPIIMLTGSGNASDIKEGVDAGVFYYLVKPVDFSVLQSVVASAIRRADLNNGLIHHIDSCRAAMSLAQSAKFEFKSPDEARNLSILLSGAFPNPGRVVVGISELMMNAIEHGNLEIGFANKAKLMETEGFAEELERRLELPEYKGRTCRAAITKKPNGTYVIISDDGPGFKPQPFLSLDPSRATSKSGRGIAQARVMSFDKLAYNEAGNQVVGFVSKEEALEW